MEEFLKQLKQCDDISGKICSCIKIKEDVYRSDCFEDRVSTWGEMQEQSVQRLLGILKLIYK
jgi:hypothetical protein